MENIFLNKVLKYYDITLQEYDELSIIPSSLSFLDEYNFDQTSKASEIIKEHISKNKKILVYGDYDADGIMSTSIMINCLKELNGDCSWIIPNRYLDGYGLNLIKAKELEPYFDLFITVDNGITCIDAINYLKNAGKTVIVLDHHEPLDILPNADAIIHPNFSNFGSINSSAGYVCFLFSKALLGRYDFYLGTLAAISTISDAMPLKGQNHKLLKFIFNNYKNHRNQIIDLLCEGEEFEETTISMKVAPKINSIGRIIEDKTVSNIVNAFVSKNNNEVKSYYDWITSINEIRKKESQEALYETKNNNDFNDKLIVVESKYKEGLIGLIASSLCAEFNKPVFVLHNNEGTIKCSARSPKGFDIINAFGACKDILLTYGGHENAGGCSFKECDIEKFKTLLNSVEYSFNSSPQENEKYIDLNVSEFLFENYDIVQSISPFGEEWKRPLLKLPKIRCSSLMYSKDLKHILSYVGQNKKIVGFNLPKAEMIKHLFVDFFGYFKISSYLGRKTLEFNISYFNESE